FFFFFQAEDGIRDKLVTGVQTCALPIFPALTGPLGPCVLALTGPLGPRVPRSDGGRSGPGSRPSRDGSRRVARMHVMVAVFALRSEERRVGKECRSWGARGQEK